MALKHIILLSVVLPAVLAGPTENPETDSVACNGTKLEAINTALFKFRTCLKDLIELDKTHTTNPTCQTIQDAVTLKGPVVTAAAACNKRAEDINTALDLIISMMNVSVTNKEILTPPRIKCISDSKEELKKCIKDNIHGQNKLADNLGARNVFALEIMNLNFQPALLNKARHLQKCVSDVWNKNTQCSALSEITNQLFEKGISQIEKLKSTTEKPSTGGAPSEFASSILMITSMLLVL